MLTINCSYSAKDEDEEKVNLAERDDYDDTDYGSRSSKVLSQPIPLSEEVITSIVDEKDDGSDNPTLRSSNSISGIQASSNGQSLTAGGSFIDSIPIDEISSTQAELLKRLDDIFEESQQYLNSYMNHGKTYIVLDESSCVTAILCDDIDGRRDSRDSMTSSEVIINEDYWKTLLDTKLCRDRFLQELDIRRCNHTTITQAAFISLRNAMKVSYTTLLYHLFSFSLCFA